MRAARPPELRVDGFRQSLRRELMRAERHRRARRATAAARALAAAAIGLACIAALFVWRPSVPAAIHAFVAGAPPGIAPARNHRAPMPPPAAMVRADYRPDDLQHMLRSAGASASSDWQWLDGWYEGRPAPSRVQALEDEKLYAVRRFQLTNGRRIVVLTEIGGDPADAPAAEMSSLQDF